MCSVRAVAPESTKVSKNVVIFRTEGLSERPTEWFPPTVSDPPRNSLEDRRPASCFRGREGSGFHGSPSGRERREREAETGSGKASGATRSLDQPTKV